MPRSFVAASLGALLVAGCSSSVPRLHQPDHIEAFCGDRVAMLTAIESIVASTSDQPSLAGIPAAAAIRKFAGDTGGIIAHWDDQPLLLPHTAQALGIGGDYVTLGDAAIGNGPPAGDSRRIYLTVKTPAGPRTVALQAYDVQDVCNEGKLKS
jgi:hypothetical protein